jgi:hypothetical protein
MPVQGYTPSYSPESPYRATPVVGNFMYYYIHRSIDPQTDDIIVTMDNPIYVERPDRLANDLYNDPELWWVFGVRNGWEDVVHDMKLGTKMFIPQIGYIRSIL